MGHYWLDRLGRCARRYRWRVCNLWGSLALCVWRNDDELLIYRLVSPIPELDRIASFLVEHVWLQSVLLENGHQETSLHHGEIQIRRTMFQWFLARSSCSHTHIFSPITDRAFPFAIGHHRWSSMGDTRWLRHCSDPCRSPRQNSHYLRSIRSTWTLASPTAGRRASTDERKRQCFCWSRWNEVGRSALVRRCA